MVHDLIRAHLNAIALAACSKGAASAEVLGLELSAHIEWQVNGRPTRREMVRAALTAQMRNDPKFALLMEMKATEHRAERVALRESRRTGSTPLDAD